MKTVIWTHIQTFLKTRGFFTDFFNEVICESNLVALFMNFAKVYWTILPDAYIWPNSEVFYRNFDISCKNKNIIMHTFDKKLDTAHQAIWQPVRSGLKPVFFKRLEKHKSITKIKNYAIKLILFIE